MAESRSIVGNGGGKEDVGGQGSEGGMEGRVVVDGEVSFSFSANVVVGGSGLSCGVCGGFAASSDRGLDAKGFAVAIDAVALDIEKGFVPCWLVDKADAPKSETPRSTGVEMVVSFFRPDPFCADC